MNADQATAIVELLTGTIQQEGVATRKVLAAVPAGNRDYKPDPKSRSAWELAVHLATADVWFAASHDDFDRGVTIRHPPLGRIESADR